MSLPSPWPTIHAERAALADDLAGFTDEQWAAPTVCTGWTVRHVVGHMTDTASLTVPAFFTSLLMAGFKLTRMQEQRLVSQLQGAPADSLARFRAVVNSTNHPPGPVDTWLGETIIHADDVRRTLGLRRVYPIDALVRIADSYKGSNLVIGTKRRIAGVALRATDTEWSHGSGPEVSGPMLSLLLAMTGRKSALEELSGEGVAVLRSR